MGPVGPRCQPKAGTLACAGRRPAYMLVYINYFILENQTLKLRKAVQNFIDHEYNALTSI